LAIAVSALTAVGCSPVASSPTPSATVFSPAHATVGDAMREFFSVRPTATQPIPFPHVTHIQKAMLTCTDYCHDSVTKGGGGIAERENLHDLPRRDRDGQAADSEGRGLLEARRRHSWQRCAGSRTKRACASTTRHIRAKVDFTTCHGDGQGTVATRNVDHTMGFCVDCHRSKQASNDCLTCHY
jgi:hypothetical protein